MRASMEHWLSGYSSAPLRRNTFGCRRFESCMLRLRMADRDGKVPGRKPEAGVHAPGRFESCAIRPGELADR